MNSTPPPAQSEVTPTRRWNYGWVIVPLAALVMVATLPGRTHGLGLITEPLLKELQVNRVDFASINLWATLIGSAFCFPVGWAIDRFGVRWVTVVTLIATGLSAWTLSYSTGAFWPLLLIVTLTRGFGQSALSVCSITGVGKWFTRHSSVAMGVYSVLLSLFFIVAFLVVGKAVRVDGWRTAWSGISMVLLFVIAPIIFLLMRDAPKSVAAKAESAASGQSLGAALRTLTFWVFAGGTAFYGLVSSGLGLFQEAVLAERGFDRETYEKLLGVSTGMSLLGQLGGGWGAARVGLPRVTAVALVLYAAALAWLPFIDQKAELWTFATLMGVAGGMIVVVFFAVWSQAFGGAHLGRIQGAAQFVTVVASAVGPLLFAKCHALYGSYSPILLGLAPVVVLLAVAAWWVKLPDPIE
jgi:MFS family permease